MAATAEPPHMIAHVNAQKKAALFTLMWIFRIVVTFAFTSSSRSDPSPMGIASRMQWRMTQRSAVRSLAHRFRGFLPVAVAVETGGFNPQTDALLEVAAVTLRLDDEGRLHRRETFACHVTPFPGARLEPASLAFTGIAPYHPFREALSEHEALQRIFQPIRRAVREAECTRAILLGHTPSFALAFINAAVSRSGINRTPFPPFSTFATATLGGLAFGQPVLARAAPAAGLEWNQGEAHSALYDAERTADLFCHLVNHCERLGGSAGGALMPPA